MKRIISLLLVFTFIISAFPAVIVFAENDYKILFEDDFNDDVLDLPSKWEITHNFTKQNSYLQSKVSMSGKALKIKDDTVDNGIIMYSPFVPVEVGEIYTANVYAYATVGAIGLRFQFYAEDKTTYIAGMSDYHNVDYWFEISNSMVAPEGAKYCRIALATNTKDLGEGYFDNVLLVKGVKWPTKDTPLLTPKQADAVNGKLVEPVGDTLKYNTYNEYGDTLADFSYAGFYQGKYELPDSSKIKTVATIEPSKDRNADDTERIQKVIDEVYENAPNNYFKVIKLKAGRYNINRNGLRLKSGIILSGEGQGPNGTVIFANDPVQYTVIRIAGQPPLSAGDYHNVLDSYITAGSNKITISAEDIKNYKVGDLIAFYYDSTTEWCDAMEMIDVINQSGDKISWGPGIADTIEERYITEINGNTITLDIPFYIPYDAKYSTPQIYKIDESERYEHIGIENLRIESIFNGSPKDENHANLAISISNAINCYVRDVSTKYFTLGAVHINGAKQITVKNCSFLEPVSTNEGSRRYSFSYGNGTQQALVIGCYAYNGRHDYTTSMPATGPLVYSDSVADASNANIDTHGTWTTGALYENLAVIGPNSYGISITNHGTLGTEFSQGWTGGGIVVWNSLAPSLAINKPPLTYQNFAIGQAGYFDNYEAAARREDEVVHKVKMYRTGKTIGPAKDTFVIKDGTSFIGDAYKESEFAPVEPRSLYKAQLAEKLTGSYKNAKPNAPVITGPRGEKEHKVDNSFTIEGIFQKGAEKVSIYIDNERYEATLDNNNYTFSLPVELKNGTHKVYATQTIDGVEGTKCADRFIVVNNVGSSNPEYLQSQYEYDKIHTTINDNVISFDEYQAPFADLQPEIITVKIGESLLKTDVDPVEINGRVLVPMRAIFEVFEADVSWDDATKTATTVRGDTVIKVTENNQIVKVNGQDVMLDVPATIIDGRFVVPVRFISETFGAEVGWIDQKRQVTIKGAAPKYISDHGLENEINIYGITQSGDNGQGAFIEYAFDNNIATMWTVSTLHENGGAWGIIDLGFARDIKEAYLAFGVGKERVHTFDIYVSNDGVNFELVNADYKSSGTTLELEKFEVNARGRYVKIVGKGNNVSGKEQWNNYTEIVFTENR